jgi:2-C-methyl-D-erythritol 4-phosphate cytidylyltransferase
MRVLVIIPSAGSGARFGGATPKQYLELDGRPVIERVVERFLALPQVARVVIPVASDRLESMRGGPIASDSRVSIVEGGATRQQSVTRALEAVRDEPFDVVAIHDAVRPFFRQSMVTSLLDAAMEHGVALPAIAVSDTIHVIEDGRVVQLLDRSRLAAAQTPQCIRLEVLRDLLTRARSEPFEGTDEASLAVRYGIEVRVMPGDPANIKITHPQDWETAMRILRDWSES